MELQLLNAKKWTLVTESGDKLHGISLRTTSGTNRESEQEKGLDLGKITVVGLKEASRIWSQLRSVPGVYEVQGYLNDKGKFQVSNVELKEALEVKLT